MYLYFNIGNYFVNGGNIFQVAGPVSIDGSASSIETWGLIPESGKHTFINIGHEIFSRAILSSLQV